MALDFFAGCAAGVVGVIVGHPFDTVKVRLQTQCQKNIIYKGTFDCFKSIVAKESPIGLYKGVTSPLYCLTAINAIVFGVQGNMQRRLPNPNSISSHFFAGSVAGFMQCVICSPMELIKTRMQVQGQGQSRKLHKKVDVYKNSIDCFRKIYKGEGIKGIFRGFWLTAMRETPSFGVYFASFEGLCKIFSKEGEEVSAVILLTSGGFSGMLSWIVTYPLDVIKTRVQADSKNEYKGMLDCFNKSIKNEGIMVLTRGLSSTLLRAFPVNAATFATVTYIFRIANSNINIIEEFDKESSYESIQEVLHPTKDNISHITMVTNFPSHP